MKTLVRKKSGIYEARMRVHTHEPIIYRSLGTRDKQVAQSKMDKLYKQMEREAIGIAIPEKIRNAAQASLQVHIKSYLSALSARASDKWVVQIEYRLGILVKECGWKKISDIQSSSFEAWRAQKDRTPKTLNDYRSALNSFMVWLINNGFTETNAIAYVKNIPVRGRHKFTRRAFTMDELQKLLTTSEKRSTLYITAVYTGLRRKELRDLEWGDIYLNAEQPYLTARASTTKNGKNANQPLHNDAVKALRSIKNPNANPNDKVFPSIPTAKTFTRDLKLAGIEQWNSRNEKVDFHALRKTFCTLMHMNGVAPRTAQELMRHSDQKLTNQVYADTQLLGVAVAVNSLPSVDAPQIAPQKPAFSGHTVAQAGKVDLMAEIKEVLGSREFCHAMAQAVGRKKWRSQQESNLQPPDS